MRPAARGFIVRVSQSSATTLVSTVVNLASTLVFPKLIGVENYSLWQLYAFYVGFVGVLQFGWNDGIYLRYGGASFEQLSRRVFSAQFAMLALSQVVITCAAGAVVWLTVPDPDRRFVLLATSAAVLILGLRTFCLYVWQATNLLGEYSRGLILESTVFLIGAGIWLGSGQRGFGGLIACDLVAKTVSLTMCIWRCRRLIGGRFGLAGDDFREAWANVSVGIKLMLANIASILVMSVVRFAIERRWDVVTFGKVSLSLSVGGLVLTFINAVGIVVYPTLRRLGTVWKTRLFTASRTLYLPLASALLLLYFPVRILLSHWLPDYAESFRFLAILFPVFLYEGRMSLLLASYLKDLREERSLLWINLAAVGLSTVLAVVTTALLGNLDLAVTSILVVVVFRATVAELVVWKRLRTHAWTDLITELLLTAAFVALNSWLSMGLAAAAFAGCYLVAVAVSGGRIRRAWVEVAALVR